MKVVAGDLKLALQILRAFYQIRNGYPISSAIIFLLRLFYSRMLYDASID